MIYNSFICPEYECVEHQETFTECPYYNYETGACTCPDPWTCKDFARLAGPKIDYDKISLDISSRM